MDLCNCNSNSSRDDLRLVRGNDFSIIYPINAKYPDGSTVEDFDLHECTDLVVLIKRDSSTAKDIMTYAEGYTITGDKELTVAYDGLKMKLGSYRLDISGKFGGKDWRSYSKDEGFGIVESNEEANIPVDAFIADGVYTVICDFLMTYQTQEQADWGEVDDSKPSYIKHKPSIPVALSELDSDSTHRTVTDSDKAYWDAKSDFSGSYDDLTDKPTIPEEIIVDSALSSTSTNPVQNKVINSALGGKVDKVNGKGLSTNDYTNTEKDKLASLSNYDDTEVRNMINAKYTKPSSGIPASDIASGVIPDISQFITKSVNDLVNYYTKSQTYTQSEVNSLISGISGFEYEVVSTLPTASASTMHKIYLTPSSDPQTQNVKDEYITIDSSGTYSWELIGNTSADVGSSFFVYDIDASGLVNGEKTIESSEPYNAINAAYQAGKVVYVRWTRDDMGLWDMIMPLNNTEHAPYSFIFNLIAPVGTSFLYEVDVYGWGVNMQFASTPVYSKPSTGIPATDLASAVQTSLGKADTSLQPSDVIDSLSSASTTAALSANQGKVLNEGKQATIDSSHKLSADLVDDSSTTNKFVTTTEKGTWNGKQDALVSGTNIKTINNESLLGSGNITIQGGGGAGDFIYDLDVSALTDPGLFPILDANFFPAIDAAYQAGKNVHVRLTHQTTFLLNGAILNLYSAQENSETTVYLFNTTVYNTDLFDGICGFILVASALSNYLLWEANSLGGTPIVEHTSSETTVSIEPNKFHIWPEMSSLNITLAIPTDSTIVNEYMIEFTSGSTATTLSLPSGVEWAESCGALSVEASKTYQISIVNITGLWTAISNS